MAEVYFQQGLQSFLSNMSRCNSGFAKKLLLKDYVVRSYTGPEGRAELLANNAISVYFTLWFIYFI